METTFGQFRIYIITGLLLTMAILCSPLVPEARASVIYNESNYTFRIGLWRSTFDYSNQELSPGQSYTAPGKGGTMSIQKINIGTFRQSKWIDCFKIQNHGYSKIYTKRRPSSGNQRGAAYANNAVDAHNYSPSPADKDIGSRTVDTDRHGR